MKLLVILCHLLVLQCMISAVLGVRPGHLSAHSMIIQQQEANGVFFDAAAPDQYFNQYVDHFDDRDARLTFKQRYWVNDTMYQAGGPIFMLVGGEAPSSSKEVAGYFWINDLAERYHGAVVSVEHRFYGESQPFTRITTDKLALLSSAQALEDFAVFASEFPSQFTKFAGSEWVSVGGSYSGSLAAWLRTKYPHIFKAALAESAPLEALDDFTAYFKTVQDTLGTTCAEVVRAIYDESVWCFQTAGDECTLPENLSPLIGWDAMVELDFASYMSAMTDVVANTVQYDKDHPGRLTVETLCSELTAASQVGTSELHAMFAELNGLTGPVDADFESDAAVLRTHAPGDAGQAWMWQCCNEFAFFQTSSKASYVLLPDGSITLDYYHRLCEAGFGIDSANVAARVAETNVHYGARNIVSSNIAFLTNSEDPWHNLAVEGSAAGCRNCVVHQTPGHAHCASMYAPRASDDAALKTARKLQVAMLDSIFGQ